MEFSDDVEEGFLGRVLEKPKCFCDNLKGLLFCKVTSLITDGLKRQSYLKFNINL